MAAYQFVDNSPLLSLESIPYFTTQEQKKSEENFPELKKNTSAQNEKAQIGLSTGNV